MQPKAGANPNWTSSYRTYSEYLLHPVFRAARWIAMRRTQGLCACGHEATEVHHANGYPPWGMFDVPGNLTPICHVCHSKFHEKAD